MENDHPTPVDLYIWYLVSKKAADAHSPKAPYKILQDPQYSQYIRQSRIPSNPPPKSTLKTPPQQNASQQTSPQAPSPPTPPKPPAPAAAVEQGRSASRCFRGWRGF